MQLTDFDYPLDDERIAQFPLEQRDSSKLLIIRRETGKFEHRTFTDITEYLVKGDVLVLNETRVIPVRIAGIKPTGGKAEITLISEKGRNRWEALVKGVHEGKVLLPGDITAHVTRPDTKVAEVAFTYAENNADRDIRDALHDIGAMPLPNYIKRQSGSSDLKQYQTVYAKNEGAIAAPTAGLHFTAEVLQKLEGKGVIIRHVTLHVGYGTFRPVSVDNIAEHRMEREYYDIPEATALAVNTAINDGRRVIAVGTTVTRTLESSASECGDRAIKPGPGTASMFIYPGYTFKILS
nr:tRNA preQ1(34) S-adenosylmethionine ribosyltransferase-isomerase QueA [bacterium]